MSEFSESHTPTGEGDWGTTGSHMARTQGLADAPWQRVPWRALLPQVVVQLPMLAAVLVVSVLTGEVDWVVGLLLLVAIFGIVSGVVTVKTLRFRVTDTAIERRSKFLSESHDRLKLTKVRSVNVIRPFSMRIFGLAKLEVTGGGNEDTITLEGLAMSTAAEFQRVVEQHPMRNAVLPPSTGPSSPDIARSPVRESDSARDSLLEREQEPSALPTGRDDRGSHGAAARQTAPKSSTTTPQIVAKLEPSWILRSAFVGFGIVWIVFLIFPVVRFAEELLPDSLLNPLQDTVNEQLSQRFGEQGGRWVSYFADGVLAGDWVLGTQFLGILLAVTLLLYILSLPANMVRYWVMNHDFTLVRVNARTLQASKGLLSTDKTTVDANLMRGVTVSDSLTGRLVGLQSLEARIVGGDDKDLLPAVPHEVVERTVAMLLDAEGTVTSELHTLGPRALRRKFVGSFTAPLWLVIPAVSIWLLTPWEVLWPVVVWVYGALTLLRLLSAIPRHRNDRYAVKDGWFIRQHGWVFRSRSITPMPRIAEWRWERSLIDRVAGVGLLTIHDGTGEHELGNITPEMATEFIQSIPGPGRNLRIELT